MKYALLFIVMLMSATVLLAGCAPQVQETAQTAPTVQKVLSQIILETAPTSATEGRESAISWRVSGDAATTPHTAIHYGPESVPNPTGPQDYPQATTFQCESSPCSIPASFSAALKIDEPGTYYYRAHAIINRESVWSEEKVITIAAQKQAAQITAPTPEIAPKVSITSAAPAIAGANQQVSVSWKVEGESTTIPHTAIHYGPESVPNPTGPNDYPLASSFLCAATPCSVPRAFQAQISITEVGTYYYRAHAIINGENFWSDEKSIEIVKPAEAPVTGGGGGGGGY